MSKQPVVL